jgi:hypothetical protein
LLGSKPFHTVQTPVSWAESSCKKYSMLSWLRSTDSVTWAHELTDKSRASKPPLCICGLSHSVLWSPWNPGRTGLTDNIFIARDGRTCSQERNSRVSARQTTSDYNQALPDQPQADTCCHFCPLDYLATMISLPILRS